VGVTLGGFPLTSAYSDGARVTLKNAASELVMLFRLGDDLANSSWVLSTFLVIPLIPLVMLLANLFG
jgi:hypothetical protein